KPFVVNEEKGLVLLNRAAESRAELVLLVGRLLRCNDEERRGIESVVPQIFENITMVTVGTRLDNGIQNCSVASSELRAVIVRLNFEFLDSVDGRLNYVGRLI